MGTLLDRLGHTHVGDFHGDVPRVATGICDIQLFDDHSRDSG